MPTLRTEDLTPFGQLAVQLDETFSELGRIGGQIERLAIDSDAGYDRAVRLMTQFAEQGRSVGEQIQAFAQALEKARTQVEQTAVCVAARSQDVQKRKALLDTLEARFGDLGMRVREVTASIGELNRSGTLGTPEVATVRGAEIDSCLGAFIDEASALRDEAREFNMRELERNAESLYGTLLSARRKLQAAVVSH